MQNGDFVRETGVSEADAQDLLPDQAEAVRAPDYLDAVRG